MGQSGDRFVPTCSYVIRNGSHIITGIFSRAPTPPLDTPRPIAYTRPALSVRQVQSYQIPGNLSVPTLKKQIFLWLESFPSNLQKNIRHYLPPRGERVTFQKSSVFTGNSLTPTFIKKIFILFFMFPNNIVRGIKYGFGKTPQNKAITSN